MHFSRRAVAFVAVSALGVFLTASIGADAAPGRKETLTDATVLEALTIALKSIHKGLCEKDTLCAAATEAELKKPPVSIEHARDAMTIGTVSGVAERCGIDWQSNFFLPMMQRFRHQVGLNQRQLTLIAMVHGMQQSMAFRSAANDICSAEMKNLLSNSKAR